MADELDERGLPPGAAYDESLEITPRQLRDLMQKPDSVRLIDCRIPAERAITSIEPSTLVPIQMLAERYEADLAPHRDEAIVVYCRIGGRSLQFVRHLRQRGFKNAKSLVGGVNLWNADIGGGPQY